MDSTAQLETYLHEIGLSEYETRAYLALLRRGIMTASTATESTDIPQSRIYNVFDSLKHKGFVKIQEGRPKKFGPVDPEVAVEQFYDYRRDEFEDELSKTQSVGQALVEEFESLPMQAGQSTEEVTDIFWSFEGKDRLIDHFGELCANAESEILMITAAYSFERIVRYHKELLAERAADGVNICLLVSGSEHVDPQVWEAAKEWASLCSADCIAGRIYLIDQRKVVMAFRDDMESRYVGVVINNRNLHETLANVFAQMWDRYNDDGPSSKVTQA